MNMMGLIVLVYHPTYRRSLPVYTHGDAGAGSMLYYSHGGVGKHLEFSPLVRSVRPPATSSFKLLKIECCCPSSVMKTVS